MTDETREKTPDTATAVEGAPEDAGRRKLLRLLAGTGAAGGALAAMPEKWSKPILEGFVAPAHAQGSFGGGGGPGGGEELCELCEIQ